MFQESVDGALKPLLLHKTQRRCSRPCGYSVQGRRARCGNGCVESVESFSTGEFVRWIAGYVCVVLLAGCGGAVPSSVTATGPTTFAQVAVVNQLQLDGSLYGHNMAVSGCQGYVSMQGTGTASRLAEVNLCGTGTAYGAAPVLVGEAAGSYPLMNGLAVNGSHLYVTYAWETNPFEVWTLGSGSSLPTVVGCAPLFGVPQAATCGASTGGTASLYGGNPFVVGNDAYVGENSDDPGQAVQVVNVMQPSAPVKVNAAPQGVTAGVSSGGATLAGLWAAGSGTTLYVGTVDDVAATDQPVTITAYDTSANAVSPVQMGAALNVPMGYALQNMSVSGTTVVATLYNATTKAWELLVAQFPAASGGTGAPSAVTVAPTVGCGFKAQNFIAMEGSYAFVGCGTGTGIEVLNVSNAAAPVVVGVMGASLNGVGFVSVQGRYVYAVDADGNLDTLDAGTVFE